MVEDGGGCEGPIFSVKLISNRRQSEVAPALEAPPATRLNHFCRPAQQRFPTACSCAQDGPPSFFACG
jgi:hypothetical protein